MTLNERIKELREQKELSQEQLSIILGTKRATLGNWETGRAEPDTTMIQKIADYFNVSIDYLMGRSSNREGSIMQSGDKTYTVVGSSDFTDEEWERIQNDFETIVALRKAQKEKR